MPVKSIDKTPKKVYVSKKAQTKHQRKSMLVKSIDKTPKKVYASKKHRQRTKEKSSDKFQS